jgi:hypothetical protein
MARTAAEGLTQTEFVVVVIVIALAALLFFPTIQHLRETGARTECQNNLGRLGLALTKYHDHHGQFPAGYRHLVDARPGAEPLSPDDTAPGWGWGAALLAHLNHEALADQVDGMVKVEDPRFDALRTTPLHDFKCPADRNTGVFTVMSAAEVSLAGAATSSYAANFGTGDNIGQHPDQGNGVFFANSQITIKDLSHGASNTLALGERGAILAQTPWAGAISHGTVRTMPDAPVTARVVEGASVQVLAGINSIALNDPASTPTCFFAPHHGVVLFALGDGAARPFSTGTDLGVLRALASRADGESHKKDPR